jgi:hypothetical protein
MRRLKIILGRVRRPDTLLPEEKRKTIFHAAWLSLIEVTECQKKSLGWGRHLRVFF